MAHIVDRIGERVEADLARAYTLPAQWYLDPEVLEAERRRVFGGTWQLVAKTAELAQPGDFVTVELVGEPLVLTRDGQGRLHGFYNVCRHRAGPVAAGCGRRRALQCAYHGWTYGLDGTLLSAREMEGTQDFDPADFRLVPVRVATWGPLVFVNLDPQAPAFEEVYGPIMEEVRSAGFDFTGMAAVERRDYTLTCNWKVYVDNYLEGYHIPIVHPSLFKELDYARYAVVTHRGYSKQFAPILPAAGGEQDRRYARYLGAAGETLPEALYYWIFPNLMLNIFPDNISTNVIVPLALDRTLTIFEWFAPPGTPAEDLRQTVAFSDQIQQEDIQICEAVHKGLSSRSYRRGRYCARRENGVHHFHRELEAALAEVR